MTQPNKASQVQPRCGSRRSTMTATEASAVSVAQSVAGGAQEFRGVDGAVRVVERKLRRVDAEIEADEAEQHHQQQEALRGERGDRRSHIGADEQPARRTCHGEAHALEHVGSLANTKPHGGPPRGVGYREVRPVSRGVEGEDLYGDVRSRDGEGVERATHSAVIPDKRSADPGSITTGSGLAKTQGLSCATHTAHPREIARYGSLRPQGRQL